MIKQNRRSFLRTSATVALALPFLKTTAKGQGAEKVLRHASIGAGGQALGDIRDLVSHEKLRLVAVADIDTGRLDKFRETHPECRVYQYWEELQEKEIDNIDSVNVSIPDHMHAKVAASFMEAGKHAYVEKPLAQTIAETRHLANLAKKYGVVTQMGTQVASMLSNIRIVEMVHAGAVGKLKSAWVWSYKTWGDPNPLPERADTPPATLDWEKWLGIATDRPYISGAYHPSVWRKRLDFGTGTLGDMGCHIFHPAFAALKLTSPLTVKSTGPKPNEDNWAVNSSMHYVFPGNDLTEKDTVEFHWCDGKERPPAEIIDLLGEKLKEHLPGEGGIIVGTKGVLLCPHMSLPLLGPYETMGKTDHPKREAPRSHYHEFVEACLGNEAVLRSSFDYAAKLTETILLGCLSSRFPGELLEWDTNKMAFKNKPEANPFVSRLYRDSWEIPGLPVSQG